RLAGYETVTIPSEEHATVSLEALDQALDDRTAAIMLTVPNTLGLFEPRILEVTKRVHEAGGLAYMDGANLNALVGLVRPGDVGFDVMHINTHKTFSTPHGGGGPGAGPVGVTEELVPYLPVPSVERDQATGEFRLSADREDSIGRMHGFHGNFGVLVRAYAYVFLHGSDG